MDFRASKIKKCGHIVLVGLRDVQIKTERFALYGIDVGHGIRSLGQLINGNCGHSYSAYFINAVDEVSFKRKELKQ